MGVLWYPATYRPTGETNRPLGSCMTRFIHANSGNKLICICLSVFRLEEWHVSAY